MKKNTPDKHPLNTQTRLTTPYNFNSMSRHYRFRSLYVLIGIALSAMGPSAAYAEIIYINDGATGHVIDGGEFDSIDIWYDGTKATIKNTKIEKYALSIVNGAKVKIENVTVNSTRPGDDAIHVQGVGHFGSNKPSGASSDLIGSHLTITSTGTGLESSASSFIDLTNVKINALSYGLDLNGSVITDNNMRNITKIDDFNITSGRSGVYAMFGAEVHLSNGTISTTNDKAHGVYIGGANDDLTSPIQTTADMKNVTVHTKGDSAFGVYSEQLGGWGAISRWDDSYIVTEGKSSHGIVGSYGGNKIELKNGSTVETFGDNAYGIRSVGGANISLDNSSVVTQGKNAVGVQSYYFGNNILKNGSVVETSGEGAHGAMVQYAGNISLQDSIITAKGADAHGLYMLVGVAENGGKSYGSGVNLQHSSIVSEQGYGIATEGGHLQANVKDGSVLKGYAGLMDVQDYTGAGTPSFNQGTTTVNLLVDGESQVSGRVQKADSAVANITLKDNSVWEFDADSNLTNLTNDNSTIRFVGNSGEKSTANHFSTLTVEGNYEGNDGVIIMNAALNGDDSLSDKLVVNGSTSGNTHVQVNNLGGLGAQTVEGIEIIEVKGDSAGNFEQQDRIVAGAYDYFLARGEDEKKNNWYLTSSLSPIPDNDAIIRPEAGSYADNLLMANTLFNSRLHDRLGETNYTDPMTGETKVTSMWMRNVVGHTNSKRGNGQLTTGTNRYVLQLGGDIAQWSTNNLNRYHIGFMTGYAHSTGKTSNQLSDNKAKSQLNGYSVGMYGTYFANKQNKTGLYVDSWAQYNWFKNTVNGDDLASEKYNSSGVTLSLESGYAFMLRENNQEGFLDRWYIQPKAQITYMGVTMDKHTEYNGTRVIGEGNHNIQTRLGLKSYGFRYYKDGEKAVEPFIELNWLYNTKMTGISMNGEKLGQSSTRNIGEIKAGAEGRFNKKLYVWFNIAQQVGTNDYTDTQGMLGLKYIF